MVVKENNQFLAKIKQIEIPLFIFFQNQPSPVEQKLHQKFGSNKKFFVYIQRTVFTVQNNRSLFLYNSSMLVTASTKRTCLPRFIFNVKI